MKRQLGTVIAVLALFCVPLTWAQSDSTDSSSSSGSSTSDSSGSSSSVGVPGVTVGGFTDPSFQTGQTGSTDPLQNDSGDGSQTNPDGTQPPLGRSPRSVIPSSCPH